MTGRTPDWKGKMDVSIWEEKTKDGEKYLSLVIGNAIWVKLFKNEPKMTKSGKPLGATW